MVTPTRLDRLPLFVPVVTSRGFIECWSDNISLGGMSLLARPGPAGQPEPGQEVQVQFALPDGAVLDLVGVVTWVAPRGSDAIACGLSWLHPAPASLERIARLAAGPPSRVLVVGADVGWRRRLLGLESTFFALEFVDELAEVATFDVAAVVYCNGVPGHERATFDDAPRVILAWPIDDRVLWLLRRGLAHGAISPDDDDEVLTHIIATACRDWHVHHALCHTARRLTRALHAREGPLSPRRQARLPTGDDDARDNDFVAGSSAMRDVVAAIDVVAPHKVVVLLHGETGTGKELCARTLHQRSRRRDKPFIVQDCGTLTETLLDSELFGHVRGAFTGATADHQGIFVVADGGTVFLDEIQNTSPALQAKLLRVIETGEVRPVGGTRVRVVDVRIIAASNVDLEVAVREGRFRSDLYYRLMVFPIRLPPLRERGRDVVTLARGLAAAAAAAHGLPHPILRNDVEDALVQYGWPGNVRQLKNLLERVVLVAGGGVVTPAHLPVELRRAQTAASLEARVQAFERSLIEDALTRAEGVILRAAEELQTNRVTLARKARAHGLL